MIKFYVLCLGALLLTACAGTMQGVLRDTGESIVISYEQGFDSDTLNTTIDNEEFTGKAVMRGGSSIAGNSFDYSGNSSFFTGISTTGDVVAKLIGNKGSILSCDLQYASSDGYTGSGGVGECKHSDGRIIDVIW